MKVDTSKILRWVPVIITTIVACVQAIGEKEDAERMDDMEERITKLEEGL